MARRRHLTVNQIHENETPSGARLVAAKDIYIDAVDAKGNANGFGGKTLVARAGHPIPAAYVEVPEIVAQAVPASEYEGRPVVDVAAGVSRAARTLAGRKVIEDAEQDLDDEDDEDDDEEQEGDGEESEAGEPAPAQPISKMRNDELAAELVERGVDVPEDAKGDELRDLVREARAAADDD